MRKRFFPVWLAVAALSAAHAWLWVTRPSAVPASPDSVFAEPEAPTAPPSPPPARPPLVLTLEPAAPAVPAQADARDKLRESPRLELDLGKHQPAHPEVDEVRLFDRERGTRAITRGVWVSETVQVRGGVGYTRDAKESEHDIAVGLGVTLAF